MADPRLNTTFPIRQFSRVPAEDLIVAFNALVNDINAALLLLGANTGGFVTLKQLKQALQSQGVLVQYSNLISSDITNTINILWTSGGSVVIGDALYSDIAAKLGYSPAQMTTLFALAETFAP